MKLLLVDDETHSLNRLVISVQKACPNDEIHDFNSPMDALEFAKENEIGIAFLDINMQSMNGIELAKRLKDINPATYIIFCTAFSQYAIEAFKVHANGYLLKPVSDEDVAKEVKCINGPKFIPSNKRIVIETFGNFEIFVDGKTLDFTRSKSKEVLAILVDYKGAVVKPEEIADIIWEDGFYDRSRQKQLHSIISDLKKTLSSVKADDILVKSSIGYSLDKSKVDCDYFRLLDGDASVINKYSGKYMYNYSWAEFTTALIDNIKFNR